MDWFIKNFFRLEGADSADCYFKPEHIIVSTIITLLFISLAIYFGLKYKDKDLKSKLKPIKVAAIIHFATQFLWLIITLIRTRHDNTYWLEIFRVVLPLFMCDIQLIAIPIAAWGKGKAQQVSFDLCVVLGILTAFMGAWFNAGTFGSNQIWCFFTIHNYINHCVPGFVSIYLILVKLYSMRFKDIWLTIVVLCVFAALALIFDYAFDYNYMFFKRSSGTPFAIFEGWANGNMFLYDLFVLLSMIVFIAIYYAIFELVLFINNKVKSKKETA